MGVCQEYDRLDVQYMDAWVSGNHDKVMEYHRKIEEHKKTCPLCSDPAGIASALWPGVKVTKDDGTASAVA